MYIINWKQHQMIGIFHNKIVYHLQIEILRETDIYQIQ